jgi:hypothetical protein
MFQQCTKVAFLGFSGSFNINNSEILTYTIRYSHSTNLPYLFLNSVNMILFSNEFCKWKNILFNTPLPIG